MYNPFIPQATDQVSQSQAQILDNFTALEPFGNGYAQLAELTVDPTLAANQVGLYAKHVGTKPALFIKNGTTSSVYDFTTATLSAGGQTRLPSGVLFKWGNATTGVGGLLTITYGTAFAHAYQVIITTRGTSVGQTVLVNLQPASVGAASFAVYSINVTTGAATAGVEFTWFAIGD